MQTDRHPHRSAVEIQEDLRGLYVECALAEIVGLAGDASYMADLRDDIDAHRAAFVGAVVTEIATLRAQLDGPLQGRPDRRSVAHRRMN